MASLPLLGGTLDKRLTAKSIENLEKAFRILELIFEQKVET
jgi:hypothetical protein